MDKFNNKALLVIDIQNDNCSPVGKMAKAGKNLMWLQKTVSKIYDFIKVCRKNGIMIFFIRTIVDYSHISNYELNKLKTKGIYGICKYGGVGVEFYKIKPKRSEIVISKKKYSAFFETNLDEQLKKQSIDELLIVGTSTHVCIESTVRDAYQHGYGITVIEDLVATRENEIKQHHNSLLLMNQQFAKVIKISEINKTL